MCLGHSRLLGIFEEFVIDMESLVVRSLEKQGSAAYTSLHSFKSLILRASLRPGTVKDR